LASLFASQMKQPKIEHREKAKVEHSEKAKVEHSEKE
jgi:hypothetical protein